MKLLYRDEQQKKKAQTVARPGLSGVVEETFC
jgi:hypothetical protein